MANILTVGKLVTEIIELKSINVIAEIQRQLVAHKEIINEFFKGILIHKGMPCYSYSFCDKKNI
ncbi:MAG: hypothetical protein ACRYE9_04480 [Janthinobacterium lividum]